MILLDVANVVAGYGAHDEVLKGVEPHGRGARAGGAHRSERRRQIDSAQNRLRGCCQLREGAIGFEGKPIGGLKPREITRLWRRLRAAGGERVSLALASRPTSRWAAMLTAGAHQRAHAGRARALPDAR